MKGYLLLFALFTSLSGISQVLTDTTLGVIAFWQVGDTMTYQFTERVDKLDKGLNSEEVSSWIVEIVVLDSTDSFYILQWRCANFVLPEEVDPGEKLISTFFERLPVIYRTNELGQFEEILNWETWRDSTQAFYTEYMTPFSGIPDSLQQNMVSFMGSLFETQDQVEYWMKEIRLWHQFFGKRYPLDRVLEGSRYYTNPYLSRPMEGFALTQVKAINDTLATSTVEMLSGIEGERAQQLMLNFVKESATELGIEDPESLTLHDMPRFQVTEHVESETSLLTGIPIKGSYIKHTEMEADYKITELQWELISR